MISSLFRTLVSLGAVLLTGTGGIVLSQDQSAEFKPRTIRALLITGGCDHDYETQKTILTAGISERCRHDIDWTVVHQGGQFENAKIEVYANEDWAAGFDIVIHNECFTEVTDPDWVDKILKPHRKKTPAILIHCTMQSYPVEDDRWIEFCGIKSKKTRLAGPLSIGITDKEHPVSRGISKFTVQNEELFVAETQSDSVQVIGSASLPEGNQSHPAIWTNRYGENNTRVFATTLGNDNETMLHSSWLDIIAKGFLWAIDENIKESFSLPGSREGRGHRLLQLGDNPLTQQSARSSSTDAEKANDGDPATVWRQDGKGLINWWEGSLAEISEIKAIAIYWESGTPFPYIIETSADGKRWQTVACYPASGIRQRVGYHELNKTIRYLRVSNPTSGLVSGIREIAAYASLRQIPFHVRSAGFDPLNKNTIPLMAPLEAAPASQLRPIKPAVAFSILDNPSKSRQWPETLQRLSLTREPEVVDGLMERLDQTDSGKIRRGAINSLANLYSDQDGNPWERSPAIAAKLEKLFSDKKVDKALLMSAIVRQKIPMRDLSQIIKRTADEPVLKELRLKLLQQNRITYNSLEFLTDLVDDPSEDLELKMKAGSLLASSPDMLAMRDAFELAVRANSVGVEGALKTSLLTTLIRNTTWEAQADWLADKTTGKTFGERQLAWEILLFLLNDEAVREPVKRFTKQHIVETENAGGNPLLSLIAVIDLSRDTQYRGFLERVSTGESGVTAAAASEALEKLDLTANLTIGSFSIKDLKSRIADQNDVDLANGELLYRKNCRDCHASGPGLESISKKFSDRNDLVDAIVNPDKDIAKGFGTFQFRMKDGNNHSGFISKETKLEIDVIDQANNLVVLRKKEITERTPLPQSSMPLHSTKHFEVDEFSDLIAYLMNL